MSYCRSEINFPSFLFFAKSQETSIISYNIVNNDIGIGNFAKHTISQAHIYLLYKIYIVEKDRKFYRIYFVIEREQFDHRTSLNSTRMRENNLLRNKIPWDSGGVEMCEEN
jgi:hypothetical protein